MTWTEETIPGGSIVPSQNLLVEEVHGGSITTIEEGEGSVSVTSGGGGGVRNFPAPAFVVSPDGGDYVKVFSLPEGSGEMLISALQDVEKEFLRVYGDLQALRALGVSEETLSRIQIATPGGAVTIESV